MAYPDCTSPHMALALEAEAGDPNLESPQHVCLEAGVDKMVCGAQGWAGGAETETKRAGS